jgi:hypothetical protein
MHASVSPKKVRQYLVEFSSVMHLWAAYNVCSIPDTANYIEDFNIHLPTSMSKFLSVAEWFRDFAESFTPSRQEISKLKKDTLFQKDIMCTLGRSYALFKPLVTWEALDDWMIKELSSYGATK